jgi:hypothetical protein
VPNQLDQMKELLVEAAYRVDAYHSLTFIKVTPGTRNTGAITSGTQPTATNYSCLGVVVGFRDRDIDGEIIKVGDRQILILVDSLGLPSGTTPPTAGDRVVGDDARTYEVIGTDRDPSGALYVLHGRG